MQQRRCNSIHPASIMTRMRAPMLGNGPDCRAREEAMVADTPMRRFGNVKEVAALAVILTSDEAACMTGPELTIDGGILTELAVVPGG
jgi:NAD(P)-dependent dehydrogenase (short-subunit alcohol dehydrogenase family)